MVSNTLSIKIKKAEAAMRERNWHDAALMWGEVIDVGGRHAPPGAWVRQARCYLWLDDLDRAELSVDDCLRVFPNYQKAEELFNVIRSKKAQRYNVRAISALGDSSTVNIDSMPLVSCRLEEVRKHFLKGWVKVLSEAESVISLVVESKDGNIEYYNLNETRKDVRSYFYKKEFLCIDSLCGFGYEVDLFKISRLGVLEKGDVIWTHTIEIRKNIAVLRGSNGWLYLANDSNRSMDQYTGKYLLDEVALNDWRDWAREFKQLQKGYKICFLIANSKEKVFPQFYPYEKSKITILDQVEEVLVSEGVEYVNPLEEMIKYDDSYYKVDTHWSDYGASIAFSKVLDYFGLNSAVCDAFEFEYIETVGDLGSKLSPVEKTIKKTLVMNKALMDYCVFDNKKQGSGLFRVYENNNDFFFDKSLVIFGGSSVVTSLIKFFVVSFRKVVLLNSPKTIVKSVLCTDADLFLFQTNERYLGTACNMKNTLSDAGFDLLEDCYFS